MPLQDVVRCAHALVAEQLRLRGIAVELEMPDEPLVVRGNRLQLEQVLVNLLSNARDAVSEAANKRITIRLVTDERCITIVVADTGAGIPSELISKIFDPFFTTKPAGVGTGLGLSISHGIIKEHRGSISVESNVGLGSRFVIHLPSA